MCERNDTVSVTITREVQVDRCLAETVRTLNTQGVHTTGSCCGHGTVAPTVTIFPKSIARARELGYTVTVPDAGDPIVSLVVPPVAPPPETPT